MSFIPRSTFASFRVLSHRDFAALWAGTLVSNIGTWVETVSLGVYVTEVTGQAGWTGGVAALTYLPSIVLSPLGGVLADRFDRRRFMAVCITAQTVLAFTLAVLSATGRLSVPVVAVLALLNGTFYTLLVPAATALISALVPPEELHNALSLDSAQVNLGRIVGPALAAVVLATGGITWALFLNAASFLAVLLALSRIRVQSRAATPHPEALWAGIVRGMRVAWEDPGIGLALGGVLAVGVLISPFVGLVPVFAIKVLALDGAATSLLVTSQGVGAVLAAFGAGALAVRLGRRRLLESSMLLLGPAAALYWLAPSLPLAAGAISFLGALYLLAFTGLKTVCQARAPKDLQARVSSLFMMVINVGYSAGVWAQAMLADQVGVRPITAGAALLFLSVVVATRVLRPRGLEALGT